MLLAQLFFDSISTLLHTVPYSYMTLSKLRASSWKLLRLDPNTFLLIKSSALLCKYSHRNQFCLSIVHYLHLATLCVFTALQFLLCRESVSFHIAIGVMLQINRKTSAKNLQVLQKNTWVC